MIRIRKATPSPAVGGAPPPPSLTDDPLFPVRDLPARLEPLIGRRLNSATVGRWVRAGVADGVKLRVVYVGRVPYTSVGRALDFFDRVTATRSGAADVAMPTTVDQSTVDAELDADLGPGDA